MLYLVEVEQKPRIRLQWDRILERSPDIRCLRFDTQPVETRDGTVQTSPNLILDRWLFQGCIKTTPYWAF